jgi:hypothetical protein
MTEKASVSGQGHNSRSLLLTNVYNAAQGIGKGDTDVAAAIVAAGGDQEDVRKEYFIGHMQGASGKTREACLLLFAKKWNPEGLKSGDDVQVYPAEFNLMNNAKTGWARALTRAGIKSSGKGAGNSNKKTKGALKLDKIKTPPKKAITSDVNLAAFIKAHAKAECDVFSLNKNHKLVKTKYAGELAQACRDHLDCLNGIIARYEADGGESESSEG